jgi:hypothetical protein
MAIASDLRPDDWSASPKLNLLVAYPYVTQRTLDTVARLGDRVRFVIDCGAVTVLSTGREITLDAYCGFLKDLPVKPWRYFSLDVISNQEQSRANYYAMLDRGFTPVPIVTRQGGDELFRIADEYWKHSDVVGFGGIAGSRLRFDRRSYVKAILEHAAGRRVHLLGFSSLDFVARYRPYMADSATWTSSDRFAWLLLYHGRGKWSQYRREDATKTWDYKRGLPDGHEAVIRDLGFDAQALRYAANWRGDNSASRWISCAAWCRCIADVERNTGTKLFMALAADSADIVEACFRAQLGEIDGEASRRTLLDHATANPGVSRKDRHKLIA